MSQLLKVYRFITEMIDISRLLPPDPTPEERKIINMLVVDLYRKLDDPVDKFILAFAFDLGYPKEDTARALDMSHVAVWKRIQKIRKLLEPSYNEIEVKEIQIDFIE